MQEIILANAVSANAGQSTSTRKSRFTKQKYELKVCTGTQMPQRRKPSQKEVLDQWMKDLKRIAKTEPQDDIISCEEYRIFRAAYELEGLYEGQDLTLKQYRSLQSTIATLLNTFRDRKPFVGMRTRYLESRFFNA